MNKEKETVINSEKENDFSVYYPTRDDLEFAQVVSQWTINYGNMLPKTPEQVLEYFGDENSVLIMNTANILISHAAITAIYSDNSIEIGSVATNSNFQRMGAATIAVRQAIRLAKSKYPNGIVFALANKFSSKLFEKMGAPTMISTDVSQDVWTPCLKCPNFNPPLEGDIFQCCDTPYNLSNVSI